MPSEPIEDPPAASARMARRVRRLLVSCAVSGLIAIVVTTSLLFFADIEGARRCLEELPNELQAQTSAGIRDGMCVLHPHGKPVTIPMQLGSYEHAVMAALAALAGVFVAVALSVYALVVLRRVLRVLNQGAGE